MLVKRLALYKNSNKNNNKKSSINNKTIIIYSLPTLAVLSCEPVASSLSFGETVIELISCSKAYAPRFNFLHS